MSETKDMLPGDKYISEYMSVSDFMNALQTNKGLVFIKFGATWCKPCRLIDDIVYKYFKSTPEHVTCAILDIDDNIDLYGYLKKKKVTHGIPVILCYTRGITDIMPIDSVTGADMFLLHSFFSRCRNRLLGIK
jgi:thiol-disulfide isomerase/thioredoxin